jgi:hypothetical protein
MHKMVICAAVATALSFGTSTAAPAKNMNKHVGKPTGSIHRGASFNAPGHVKKRMGLQSARSVAPGRTHRLPPGQMPRR